jgi:uncharacterized membrane protein HdeD (DUF308 family)
MEDILMDTVKPMWEALVVRGIAGILFGIAAVFWPSLTLVTLVYIFSIYILISGVVGIVTGVNHLVKGRNWFLGLLLGFAELGVGVYLVRHPLVSFATLILIIGLILVARGVFEVVMGLTEDSLATHKLLVIIAGLLSAAVGVIILLQPAAGGVAFVWVLGLYALITGPVLIALGLDVRNAVEGKRR